MNKHLEPSTMNHELSILKPEPLTPQPHPQDNLSSLMAKYSKTDKQYKQENMDLTEEYRRCPRLLYVYIYIYYIYVYMYLHMYTFIYIHIYTYM